MTSNYLVRGFVIGFSIAAPVGPIGVLCIRRSLANGKWVGLATGLGAATADAAYGAIAGFGLTAISTFLISQRLWLNLFGGTFLCYLGLRTFVSKPAKASAETEMVALGPAYISTALLTLANPMTIFSFLAVFAGLGLATAANYVTASLLVVGVFIGSALWWIILSTTVGGFRSRVSDSWMQTVNRLSGCLILGFGIYSFWILAHERAHCLFMKLEPCPFFINGDWIDAKLPGTPVFNPSIGEVIAECPAGGIADVNAAVEAAAAAFPGWMETPPVERARVLFRFKMLLEENFEDLVRCNTREHGKTLAESRGDVKRGMEVVEFACGVPSLLMGEVLENVARGIDCEAIRQPLGVCVGITPFNFPAMVPLWMYPVALACGNTFVLKPSEKVPLTAIKIVKLLDKAGLPKGVFNIVHGGREVVDGLLMHPKVKAISFVGSTPIARYVYETGIKYGKRVQCGGGAKNFVLLMPDADVENSTRGVIEAAFGCAGERCMAGSTAVVVGAAEKTVLPTLIEATRKIKVGPTDREMQPDMGALITRQHRDRVLELIEAGVKEGAKVAADGRGVKVAEAPNGYYVGATILDQVQNSMTVAREEIFGPVLNVMRMEDLDAAIELANKSNYGNGASIFTRSGKAAREFKHRINCGMVGINIGVPASMAWFPFNGWNDSFFGDLHMQGREGVQFFTQQKVTTSRWFSFGEGDVWHREK